MRLLVTRPADDAERTARALERLGHEPVISPALQVRYLIDVPLPAARPQAILVTSTNAVNALQRHRQAEAMLGATVLAVGDRTAVAARRAGFAATYSAGGDVDDLVALVRRHCSPDAGPLLYAAGADQASDLAGRLGEDGYDVETAVVYTADCAGRLAAAAAGHLRAGTIDGALFFSARSAECFGEQIAHAGLAPLGETIACFCLSEAVGRKVTSFANGALHIAAEPNQLALIALIEDAGSAASQG
jgi:uroporphyrinogen-III synthase